MLICNETFFYPNTTKLFLFLIHFPGIIMGGSVKGDFYMKLQIMPGLYHRIASLSALYV